MTKLYSRIIRAGSTARFFLYKFFYFYMNALPTLKTVTGYKA